MSDGTEANDVFISGLKNAHAMEKQALSIMQPQLNRLEHYPQVSEMLAQHIRETEGQLVRLEEVLDRLGVSSSTLKDMALSLSGSMAALGHTVASDEILKNSFANYAFEHFEIAAYTSLITVAQATGARAAVSALEANLAEERQMAARIEQGLETVTRTYLQRTAQGERADI